MSSVLVATTEGVGVIAALTLVIGLAVGWVLGAMLRPTRPGEAEPYQSEDDWGRS